MFDVFVEVVEKGVFEKIGVYFEFEGVDIDDLVEG